MVLAATECPWACGQCCQQGAQVQGAGLQPQQAHCLRAWPSWVLTAQGGRGVAWTLLLSWAVVLQGALGRDPEQGLQSWAWGSCLQGEGVSWVWGWGLGQACPWGWLWVGPMG